MHKKINPRPERSAEVHAAKQNGEHHDAMEGWEEDPKKTEMMKQHPLSAKFPAMSADEFESLKEDLEQFGQRDPIIIYENMVLDGWNRYRALEELGLGSKTEALSDVIDPVSFVFSKNLHRRHLDAGQRGILVAECREWQSRGRPKKGINAHLTNAGMAKDAHISERTMKNVKVVMQHGLSEDVKNGKMTITAAAKQVQKPSDFKPKPKEQPAPDAKVLDRMGYPVPKAIIPLWNRGPEITEILSIISKARCALREATEKEDLLYSGVSLNSALSRLDLAYSELEPATPSVVCTTCQGVTPKSCTFCRGRGFISKFAWKTQVPEEVKAMRKARIKELEAGGK